MTKKELAVYNKYGIEIVNGKIKTPIDGVFTTPLLKNGNSKVGKGVYTFSTLPTNRLYNTSYGVVSGTCKYNCTGCYATKGCYNFKSVIDALALNTILIRKYTDFVESCINAQIEIIGSCDIRISAAGDLETVDTVNMWRRIAQKNTTCRFWTYTKFAEFETAFDDLQNANIVKSVLPCGSFNFGHIDYILNKYAELTKDGCKPYICKCGIDANQHCNNCNGCRINKYVLFIEHSTDYVATEDALFADAVNIINNQDGNNHIELANIASAALNK